MGDPLDGRQLCHINLASGYRGGERQVELLMSQLASQGLSQHLIIRRDNPLGRRCASLPGLTISEVSFRVAGAALAAKRCQLVHAHEGQAFYAAALANRLFGMPYVLTRRVPNPQKPSMLRTMTYSRAAQFAGVSQAVATNVRKRYPQLDVAVIPDAHASLRADEVSVAGIRARFPGKQLIGHVGALDDAHKGQRTLLAVARRASAERPDWHFLLCGDGKDEQALRDEAQDLNNVSFEGFVSNVGDYLASFDVFVFPSNFEALGSSLLDAMYFGLPIVASNVGGIPEFVEHGVNGLLVPPGAASDFFGAIDDLQSDIAMKSSMSEANAKKATRFDAATMASAYLEIYRRALSR